MNILHKGTQKRIHILDAAYFITVKTDGNHPFFRESIFCDLFVENLRLCKRSKGFELYGWFLGYDHFHLVVRPNEKFDLSKIMQSLKRNFSHNANIIMGYNEGANNYSRLRLGYRIMLHRYRMRFIFTYDKLIPFSKFKWQKSFRDHYCRGESDFRFHLGYILRNPAKHKMPENWPYIYSNPTYADLVDDCGLN